MKWVRAVVALLIIGAVALAAVPMLVLLDLASGSDGYGLCPRGLDGCRTAYTAAPELAVILVLLLFAVLALLRIAMAAARRAERKERIGQLSRDRRR